MTRIKLLKNFLTVSLLFLIGTARVSADLFQDINMQSSENDVLRDNTDSDLTASFNFQLGVFQNNFTPSTENIGDWLDNWVVFHVAEFDIAQETGQPDKPVFAFDEAGMTLDGHSVFAHSSNNNYDFSNQNAWLWVYNDSQVTPTETTEWFMGRADNWVFPDAGDFDPDGPVSPFEINWSLLDFNASNVPIWGSQSGEEGGGYREVFSPSATLQTYKVIPEPGTWVLMAIAGLSAALGLRSRGKKGAKR